MFGKHLHFLLKKNFNAVAKEEIPLLNSYLQDSLFSLSKRNLKDPQMNIIESLNKSSHSVILCDEFSGRKYSCMLGIMNRLINNKNKEDLVKSDEDFFVNTVDSYKKKKENAAKNLEKKLYKPRGALIICQKFEFATHFYRICRKLDHKNQLKMVRVGTSLHTVAPTVELDEKSITDSDEIEAFEKQEMLIGNINLINTTEWKDIDMLFITPQMLDYVLTQKEDYDYFDINPEIIMIDDFDYIVNVPKYDIKKQLMRFFAADSLFPRYNRKLILTSSSIQMEHLLSKSSLPLNFQDKLSKSLDYYKHYLLSIHKELPNCLDVVISPYFMNLEHHIRGIKVIFKHFDGEAKSTADKKLKSLSNIVDNNNGHLVICCSDSSMPLLKEYFKKRRLHFASVDEGDRVGQRLFSIMLYNKYDSNILVITPVFLKSLNIVKMNQMVLFDFIADQKDLIRILAKFPKTEDSSASSVSNIFHTSGNKSLHIFYDNSDAEKQANTIEYLSKHK